MRREVSRRGGSWTSTSRRDLPSSLHQSNPDEINDKNSLQDHGEWSPVVIPWKWEASDPHKYASSAVFQPGTWGSEVDTKRCPELRRGNQEFEKNEVARIHRAENQREERCIARTPEIWSTEEPRSAPHNRAWLTWRIGGNTTWCSPKVGHTCLFSSARLRSFIIHWAWQRAVERLCLSGRNI